MKKLKIKNIVFVLIFSVLTFAGVILDSFTVTSRNDQVILEWRTQDEVNIEKFEILRKNQNTDFVKVTEVKATGSYSVYKFTDKNVLKTNSNNYTYKLRFIDTSGNTDGYSSEKSIMPNLSSVKRTWGSIKALFR